jgi:small subunit ribosomal protein S8
MTYVNDPIGDFLTRMRNAQGARRATCSAPWSRMKQDLAELLKKEGWLESFEVKGEVPKQEIEVTFVDGKTLELKRVSKPGRRVYAGFEDLKPILRGYGIAILTTSQGLMTDVEARQKKVGGEVLCTIS